jgi:hypothetical protein
MSVEVIIRENSTIIVSETDYYTPINHGTQGPEGPPGVGIPGPVGPAGTTTVNKLTDILDVDTTVLVNGSVLVYSTNGNIWKSTTSLDKQTLDCGQF